MPTSFQPRLKYGPCLVLVLYWLGATAGYLISAFENYVAWCIPHIEGCTSISRAGRFGTSFYTFKLTMIPVAVLVFIYWLDVARWHYQAATSRRILNLLPTIIGCLGAIALLLQMTFLGLECEYCRTIRSNSTTLCFLLTFLAQWLLCVRLKELSAGKWVRVCYILVCVWLSVELIMFMTIPSILDKTSALENTIAWRSSYLISLAPAISAWGWYGNKITYTTQRR